jgi:hypothetical protein
MARHGTAEQSGAEQSRQSECSSDSPSGLPNQTPRVHAYLQPCDNNRYVFATELSALNNVITHVLTSDGPGRFVNPDYNFLFELSFSYLWAGVSTLGLRVWLCHLIPSQTL